MNTNISPYHLTSGIRMFLWGADNLNISPKPRDDWGEYGFKVLARAVYALVVQYIFTFIRIFYLGALFNGACAFGKGCMYWFCEATGKQRLGQYTKLEILNHAKAHLYYGLFDAFMNFLPWYFVVVGFGTYPLGLKRIEEKVSSMIANRTTPGFFHRWLHWGS